MNTHQAPDIETFAALRPDLSVGPSYHALPRDALSLIVDVVLGPVQEKCIRIFGGELTDQTNRRTRYAELAKEYDSLVAGFRDRVPDAANTVFTPVKIYGGVACCNLHRGQGAGIEPVAPASWGAASAAAHDTAWR